jgi:signal transduction histidine kinase
MMSWSMLQENKMTRHPASASKNNGEANNKYVSLPQGKSAENDAKSKPLLTTGKTLNRRAGEDANPVSKDINVYRDRDGIPVLYDKTVQDQAELKRAAIKILWHDIFAPITLIKGYTSTMHRFGDFITEQQKEEYLRGIDSATKRLVFVLEKLRFVTGLEEMRNMSMQPTVLTDLLRKICADTQERAKKHIINFRPRNTVPKINVNQESIEVVLHNLLDNAIKYSPNGGDIEVELITVKNRQELERFFPGAPKLKLPSVVVSVLDNGIGMPDADREKVFDKFYRVNSPWTRSIPGLGLGLYINKINIETHGGCVWSKKRFQGGSIFSFSLPIS